MHQLLDHWPLNDLCSRLPVKQVYLHVKLPHPRAELGRHKGSCAAAGRRERQLMQSSTAGTTTATGCHAFQGFNNVLSSGHDGLQA